MVQINKKCSLCQRAMKPFGGGAAFKCKCGNAYIKGQGYIRLQHDEDIFIREGTVHGKYVFYPEIRKISQEEPREPEELTLFYQPQEWKASGPYQRNAAEVLRGGIYYVAFSTEGDGHEIKKHRPCVVVSNVQYTDVTSIVTVIPLTTRSYSEGKTHVTITSTGSRVGTALIEQITTVDVRRLGSFMGQVSVDEMMQIKKALNRYFGLSGTYQGSQEDLLTTLDAENYALKKQLQEMTDEVNRLRKERMQWEKEKCQLQTK